jgi:hypothetical protein
MRFSPTNLAVAALGAGVAVVAAAGTGYAYWSATATGTGSGTTASGRTAAQALTTSTPTTTGAALRPEGTGDVVVTITNPNSFPVSVTAIALNAAGAKGCTTPALTAGSNPTYSVGGTATSLPLGIAANGSKTVVVNGAVTMGATASSDCQGTTLSVPVTLSWTG